MTRQFAQLGAMVKYELLMHWRRRSLLLTIIFLFIGVVGFTLLSTKDPLAVEGMTILYVDDTVSPALITTLDATGQAVTFPADAALLESIPSALRNVDLQRVNASIKIVMMLTVCMVLLVIMLLLMNAETIPLDKQYHVRELLNTLPLGHVTYLGGKVLGVWVGLVAGLLVCMVVYIPVAWSRFGAFDLTTYFGLWGLLLIPCAVFASGLSVLGAAGASTRRAAVLVGIALIPIGLFVFAQVLYTTFIPFVAIASESFRGFSYGDILATMFGGVVQIMLAANTGLLALGVLVWGLMRGREGR